MPEHATQASIEKGFHVAYEETCLDHPCFGGPDMSTREWWKRCVTSSFAHAGQSLSKEDADAVFQRVYARFGSHNTYEAFADAAPFLRWARRRGLVVGVISNADERYVDDILPMLGLDDDVDFCAVSKLEGCQKPEPAIFDSALRKASAAAVRRHSNDGACVKGDGGVSDRPILPHEVLHLGDSLSKDYQGATRAGFHAGLLDRSREYGADDEEAAARRERSAQAWSARCSTAGAPVFFDLLDVVDYLGRHDVKLGETERDTHANMQTER